MNEVFKSSTSHSIFIELVDSSTGLPKTGIVYTDCAGSYVRARSARVAVTMATLASASASFTSGGFVEVDATNQPGIFRWDVPDAAFATGVDEVVVTLKATGCRTQSRGFTLVNWNKQAAALAATDIVSGGAITTSGGVANANVTQFAGETYHVGVFMSFAADYSDGYLNTDLGGGVLGHLVSGTGFASNAGGYRVDRYDGSTIPTAAANATAVGGELSGRGMTTLWASQLATDAGSAATNSLTAASGVTTLLTRITSTLFSGITSLAAWLRLDKRRDTSATGYAAALSEVNATGTSTFDPTTDSGEAIRDKINTINTDSAGTGSNTVTVTVRDEDDQPVQSARVRIEGTAHVLSTNGSGQAVFLVNNGTYTFIAAKEAYIGGSTTPPTITANASVTVLVETITITPSSDPDYTTGWMITRDGRGAAEANVPISFKMLSKPTATGSGYDRTTFQETSDGNALLEVQIPCSTRFLIWRGETGRPEEFWTPASPTASFELPSVLGDDTVD